MNGTVCAIVEKIVTVYVLFTAAIEPLNVIMPERNYMLGTHIYAYGKVSEKRDLACIIKKNNKNALRLKCYNFRMVNAIVFLFSALNITPFLYGKILFGILHLLLASIATFDTQPGSNPPYLSVGVMKSLQIRYVGREVLYLSICSVR